MIGLNATLLMINQNKKNMINDQIAKPGAGWNGANNKILVISIILEIKHQLQPIATANA